MIGSHTTGLDFHAGRGEGGRGKGAPAGVFRVQHDPQPEFLGGGGGVSPCEQGLEGGLSFPIRTVFRSTFSRNRRFVVACREGAVFFFLFKILTVDVKPSKYRRLHQSTRHRGGRERDRRGSSGVVFLLFEKIKSP